MKSYMFSRTIALFLLFSFSSCTSTPCINIPQVQMLQKFQSGGTQRTTSPSTQQARQTQPTVSSASPYWTGDGGKGKSITILPPRAIGLAKDQAYLPDFIANELISNFDNFSDMTLFNRVTNQRQYDELLSGYYADNDAAGLDLGHLSSTDYMLLGDITKTTTGYALQLTINRNRDKTTVAAYSGSVSIIELDNLTGVRRASLDILGKIGIQLTAQARAELTKAATTNHVNAQTSMAQGIAAQRQGNDVLALSYFFQAEAFDASIIEAVNRTNVLSTNISTGNIGADVRNDFAWHDDWRAKLTETETLMSDMLRNTKPQRSVWYSNDVTEHEAARDHVKRTTELRIETVLHTHAIFPVSVQRTVQTVYDGLQSTGRAQAWRLNNWPRQGVTNSNPFNNKWGSIISITFEVLNGQEKVIGRQTVELDSMYSFNGTRLEGPETVYSTVRFTGVSGDDIHYPLAIRIASINGRSPEEAGISRIEPISANQIQTNRNLTIYNGAIRPNSRNRDIGAVVIPAELWSERVDAVASGAFDRAGVTSVTFQEGLTNIRANAFANNRLSSVTIPKSVNAIGASAFANNRLTNVILNEGVVTIGEKAFADNHWTTSENLGDGSSYTRHHGLSRIKIPNSVTSIGQEAFACNWTTRHYNQSNNKWYTVEHWLVTEVIIGANVRLGNNAIGGKFETLYNASSRQAGVFRKRNTESDYKWERFDDEETLQRTLASRAKGMTALIVVSAAASSIFLLLVLIGVIPLPKSDAK